VVVGIYTIPFIKNQRMDLVESIRRVLAV